jgi:hypothetical protein
MVNARHNTGICKW